MQILVVYDTRTGNTDRMAQAVAEGARAVDKVEVVLKRVREAGDDLADADAIIVGSPTHSKQPSQAMKKFLSDLSQVSLKDKVGAAFGSYGWSGEAPGIIERTLKERGLRVAAKALRVRGAPGEIALTNCRNLGRTVATSIAHV